MDHSEFRLRRMQVDDANLLSQLMHSIYPAAYRYLWEDGGRWYLKNMYAPAQLVQELADAQNWFWMIEDQSRQARGWMKLIPGQGEPTLSGKGLYLQRIYLAPEVQGMGLGKYMCDWALTFGQQFDCTYIWLESMDSGPALGFYQKLGYRVFAHQRLAYPGMIEAYRTLLSMQRDIAL